MSTERRAIIQTSRDRLNQHTAALKKLGALLYGDVNARLTPYNYSDTVTADSSFCHPVNLELAVYLSYLHLPVRYIPYKSGQVIVHGFDTVATTPHILLDFQYRQFVPKDKKAFVPPYLAIPYESREDVVQGLKEHHVPEAVHHYWIDPLFPEREPLWVK